MSTQMPNAGAATRSALRIREEPNRLNGNAKTDREVPHALRPEVEGAMVAHGDLAALGVVSFKASITSPVALVTFKFLIDELASKLGMLIEKAANQGQVLIASAGAEVATAIEYAKTAFADSLELTTEHLKAAQQSFLNDITTEIGYIEDNVIGKLREIVERGSMALNTLPLSNKFPQVGWYTPSYIAPNEKSITVEFNGNFFDAARKGYDPLLKVNGHTIVPDVKTTLRLAFTIDASILGTVDTDLKRVRLDLEVPYRKKVLGVIPERDKAQFSAALTLLPPNAGTIEFDTDRLETRRFTQPNQSGTLVQESTDDDIPDPIGSGQVAICEVTPGWFVNPADVRLVVEWAEGDWTDFGNRSNVTHPAWSIATRHHRIGTSGKVHFHLAWTEYQDRPVHVPAQESTTLEWGASHLFSVPPGGTWHATYTDFRGESQDIGGAQFENPFVRIITSGDSVMIVTVP